MKKIFELIEKEQLMRAKDIVDSKRVKNAFFNLSEIKKEEIELLEEVLEILEYAIIDNWRYAFDTKKENRDNKKQFTSYCRLYFKLKQAIPLPENKTELMKRILQLITFSYLGEKWEDMRRFVIENEKVWNFKSDEEEWDGKIFYNIYQAVMHLIKKESWNDLGKSCQIISDLKQQQKEFEKKYLNSVESKDKIGSALELASLYHLARSVELLGEYMLQGSPKDIIEQLEYHFEKAISYSQSARIIELDLILRMLHGTFKKMVFNSVWYITNTVNSRVTKYVKLITQNSKPVFELLYPQRIAILEKGLLDPANKAIVVNLPTSSGKTMIAEFRILQALNQFSDDNGWIVYVAPTRALVNQITARLRKNLSKAPLNINVQKMSGALEIDAFEENMLEQENTFEILVTTPEKLNLLIRQGIEEKLNRPLVLAIIDEAHNIGDNSRGLNFEMLLSIIKKDCKHANLLLLTPYIPNSDSVAEWLDPQNPKSISIELNWQPNDRVIGMFYPEGRGRKVNTFFKPMITSHETIVVDDELLLSESNNSKYTYYKLKSRKYLLASVVAEKIKDIGNMIVLGYTPNATWKIAKELSERLPRKETLDERIILVKKFIAAEMGNEFPLVNYLDYGIGIHNAGLPDEIKILMEWLMEEELLNVLVATTTIAQGINFPVSAIVMATYSYPLIGSMPSRDFWNLAGRAGRMDQKSVGIVGIAVDGKQSLQASNLKEYVGNTAEDLVSVLVKMVEDAMKLKSELNLRSLANFPEWSSFLQYISHMYKQSQDLQNFNAEVEITLKRTFGYNSLNQNEKTVLLNAVKNYAEKLDGKKHLATLSDMTGFAPESIEKTIKKVSKLGIKQNDWNSSKLFSSSSDVLRKLMGIMITVPEVKKQLDISVPGKKITHSTISRIVSDWVSGKDVIEISKEYFGGTDTTAVSKCVNAIYSKISNFATWGLAAMQKIPGSGLNFDEMSEEEKKKLNNVPAMVFYGVNSDEAIVMRMNNVPRSIAHNLGKMYSEKVENIINEKPSKVNKWLRELSDEGWSKAIPSGKKISGKEYKKIWKRLAGYNN
ncbi:DEAD/DEAH box helicase [Candidatus Woesearchaeota archaeon]|nr:DEAD/DEAH box helicase [Candidatus Woesearchaeota archaeon]